MYAPISAPSLPPINGYLEVEIDGVRQYEKINTPQDTKIATLEEQVAAYSETIAQLETENSTLTSTLDALLSDVLPVLMVWLKKERGTYIMSTFMAQQIMKQANISLAAGQQKYRVYFINTPLYQAYRADADTILQTTYTTLYPDGYGDCIVTA